MIETQPGDLVFYRVTPQSGWRAKLIVIVQMLRREGKSAVNYSHVAIADGTGGLIESWWPRVRARRIDWTDPNIEIWRVPDMVDLQRQEAVRWAKDLIGEWYDVGEMFFGLFGFGHAGICSRLVARSWATQGVDMAAGFGRFLAPNELVESGKIVKVEA